MTENKQAQTCVIRNEVNQVMSTHRSAMSVGFAFGLGLIGLSSTTSQMFQLTVDFSGLFPAACQQTRDLQSETRLRSAAIG